MYNMTTPVKSVESPTEPITLKRQNIMLTLNFANAQEYNQKISCKPRTRLTKVANSYYQIANELARHCDEMSMSLEVSPVLNSKGDAHFPRIHAHILTFVKNPIGLLLDLAYYSQKGVGYHIARIKDEKDFNIKQEYISKDFELWKTYNECYDYLSICYHKTILFKPLNNV